MLIFSGHITYETDLFTIEAITGYSMVDFIRISGTMENRVIEYVDHLHEHCVDPCVVRQGCYLAPTAPGYSIRVHSKSLEDYAFPDGKFWASQ